jgi:hypothetical protein
MHPPSPVCHTFSWVSLLGCPDANWIVKREILESGLLKSRMARVLLDFLHPQQQ